MTNCCKELRETLEECASMLEEVRTGTDFEVECAEVAQKARAKLEDSTPCQCESGGQTECNHAEVEVGKYCTHCGEKVGYMFGVGTRKVTESDCRRLGKEAARNLRKALEKHPEVVEYTKKDVEYWEKKYDAETRKTGELEARLKAAEELISYWRTVEGAPHPAGQLCQLLEAYDNLTREEKK